jgi:hypothetical protein
MFQQILHTLKEKQAANGEGCILLESGLRQMLRLMGIRQLLVWLCLSKII